MTQYKNTGFSAVVDVAWLLRSLPCNALIDDVALRSVPSTLSCCVVQVLMTGPVHDFFVLTDSVLGCQLCELDILKESLRW